MGSEWAKWVALVRFHRNCSTRAALPFLHLFFKSAIRSAGAVATVVSTPDSAAFVPIDPSFSPRSRSKYDNVDDFSMAEEEAESKRRRKSKAAWSLRSMSQGKTKIDYTEDDKPVLAVALAIADWRALKSCVSSSPIVARAEGRQRRFDFARPFSFPRFFLWAF